MSVYQDELSTTIRMEEEDNNATREDWERALDMVYGARPMKIELLHVRDPDSSCDNALYINGEQVRYDTTDYSEENVDPGYGYEEDDWNERIEAAREDETYSPAFKTAVLEALGESSDSPYITGGHNE